MIETLESFPRVSRTANLPSPNPYVGKMTKEFGEWTYDEERAPKLKGVWRKDAFGLTDSNQETPLDLEIGVGNGYFFAHRAYSEPKRALLGIELKYKPLVQTIQRAVRTGAKNARVIRYDATLLEDLFGEGELNDVFIFFPDPWPKRKTHKHRLIQPEFLEKLFRMQRPGSKLEFKTDNREYFDWTVERVFKSSYKVTRQSYNLHGSEWASENFKTHFERLWTAQGLPTHYLRLEKPI